MHPRYATSVRETRERFPYGVEMPVPRMGGFHGLQPMHDWAAAATRTQIKGVPRYAVIGKLDTEARRYVACFHFEAPVLADRFQQRFGGTRVNPTLRRNAG